MTEPIIDGVLEHVDPNTLTLEMNVRPDQALTKQFIASIKENGVLVPITAVRIDGALTVRAGARRTMAAREAELDTVPVYVIDAATDTATRLVQQITENDQRLGLRADDRVRGIQTLLDTGLTPTKVAKRLAVSVERVKQSKAVASSEKAMAALTEHTVSLAEAAAIAEFEGDDDAVDRLMNCAGGRFFDHEVSRLRQSRESRKQWERAAEKYRKEGYEVLTEAPEYHSKYYVPMKSLATADSGDVEAPTNPANWAVLIDEESVITDKETGEQVEEELVDWATEDQPDRVPEEGMRHFNTVTETVTWVATEFYCTNVEAEGLVVDERYNRFSGLGATAAASAGGGESDSTGDLAAAREKRERRKVLTMNKAGEAAESVRREFVTNLVARKNPPKGTAVFIGHMLACDPYLLSNFKATEVVTELLGARSSNMHDVAEQIRQATDARAQVLTLAMVLGALEGRTPKDAWRSTNLHLVGPRQYLGFLADLGYALSPVEQVMAGLREADDVYSDMEEAK